MSIEGKQMKFKESQNDAQASTQNGYNLLEEVKIETSYYLEQLSKIFKAQAKNLYSYSATEEAYVMTKLNDLSLKIIEMDDASENDKNMAEEFIDSDTYPISSFDTSEIRPELLSMANKKDTTKPTLNEMREEYQSTISAKRLLLRLIESDYMREEHEKKLEQHNEYLLELEKDYPECCI